MLARPPGAAVVPLTRRWKHSRLVRSGAYKIGEALGDRVLVGKTPGGSPMALCMRDHQHRAIYFHGEYEPEIAALFRRFVTPESTVFDVGANAGYFSLLSGELGARVHAFEPNPSVRALLTRSVRLGSGDIVVVPAACSDHEGVMPLYLSDPGNTGMSSVIAQTGTSVEVEAITLDGYSRRVGACPDLIKIDVEGHEREVLLGAKSLLATTHPIVIAETGGRDTIDLMKGFDYTPHRIRRDGSTPVHDGRMELVGGYENICFVPAHVRSGAIEAVAQGARVAGVASQFTTLPASVKAERANGPSPVTEKM
jgi:FkbM family methyltransferase